MSDIPIVNNNYELDNALIGSNMQTMCICRLDGWQESLVEFENKSLLTYTKPVAAYLVYIEKKYIPEGIEQSYTLSKKKGLSVSLTSSFSMTSRNKVGGDIYGCESEFSITTGFAYTITVDVEETETWTTTLKGEMEAWTYQPVIVYATSLDKTDDAIRYFEVNNIDYFSESDKYYYLSGAYRNSPSVTSHGVNVMDKEQVFSIIQEKYNVWADPFPQTKGTIYHSGANKYLVLENASTDDHTPIIFWDTPGDFNHYVLTKHGLLFHEGAGKFVVAENASTGNHTRLIIFHGVSGEFNKILYKEDRSLYHVGSGAHIVAENADTGNHTKLILYHQDNPEFNTYEWR